MISDFLRTSLACPACKSALNGSTALRCESCQVEYVIHLGGIPAMLRPELTTPENPSPNWYTTRKRFEAEHFSSVPDTYFESLSSAANETNPYQMKLSKQMENVFATAGSGAAVLDIGGGARGYIEKFGLQSTAVVTDISLNWLTSVQRPGDRSNFVASDCEELPFFDGSFDLVVINGVLHHVPRQACALREIDRVLKPGGSAIVIEPAKWSVALIYYLLKRAVFLMTGAAGLKKYLHYYGSPYESYLAPRLIRKIFDDSRYQVEIVKTTPIRLPFVGGWAPGKLYARMLQIVEKTWLNDCFGSYLIARIRKHGGATVDPR